MRGLSAFSGWSVACAIELSRGAKSQCANSNGFSCNIKNVSAVANATHMRYGMSKAPATALLRQKAINVARISIHKTMISTKARLPDLMTKNSHVQIPFNMSCAP